MTRDQMQLDIFEPGSKTQKRAHRQAYKETHEARFPARLCIVLACAIVVVVVSFALGVERGKAISRKEVPLRYLADSKAPKPVAKSYDSNVLIKREAAPKKRLEKIPKDVTLDASAYIIQVATYRLNSSYADKEIDRLKKDGYSTFAIKSGNYIQICAGRFITKADAQIQLKKLKKKYKDCFIRKI